MAASLKRIDASLKKYLRDSRLPDIYEALLTGLAVMCPDDPLQFLIDKLEYLQLLGLEDLEWDSFIEPTMKPTKRIMKDSNIEYIFNFDASMQLEYEMVPSIRRLLRIIGQGQFEPTPEMYEKAYSHYNRKLKQIYYGSWMQYYLVKARKRRTSADKQHQAATHQRERTLRFSLRLWKQWFRFRKGRQAMANNIIRHVYQVSVGRVIFRAWHNEANESRLTREYFERLERGDNLEDDEVFGYGSGEARDEISMLSPKKLALKIFGHLDVTDLARCAKVCRSWKVLTQSSALWSTLDITKIKERKITDGAISKLLLKSRPYLLHLNLRGCETLGPGSFISIRACKNLQDLNLAECSAVNDEMIKVVAEGCKILLYLNLAQTDISDAGLRHVAENCVNLQYLSLAFCQRFSDKGLEYISEGKGAKKLTYIDLSRCNQVTVSGYRSIADGCPSITSLVLDDLPVADDSVLKNVLEKCKEVKSVSLLGSSNVTDSSIKKLTSNKKLQKLKVENNPNVTDAAFKHIGKQCPELRHFHVIDCPNITDQTLRSIATCRYLTVLNLADCVRISEAGVRSIVESPCNSSLRELNLTNCLRVGDIALVGIYKRCRNLAYLSLCFCERITDTGIELLGQTRSLCYLDITGCSCGDAGLTGLGNNPRLKNVSLSECCDITDLGVQKFAQRCTDIERLDLSHCQQLTDGAIKTLAFSCRMLTGLNVAGCRLLTDLTVQYLSGVCHYLNYLDISGSLFISDKSLRYLRKGCRKLHTLVMLYCRNISKHSAKKMRKFVVDVQYSDEQPSYPFDYVVY